MCRWLIHSGSPIYLEQLLFEPENSLIHQSLHARKGRAAINGDGFGVGWYGEREVPGTYHGTARWNSVPPSHLVVAETGLEISSRRLSAVS